MNRRGFLRTIAAIPIVPVVAKLGLLDRVLPFIKREMSWKFVKFTGFKESQDSLDFAGQIYGQKSDGSFFFQNITVLEGEIPPELFRFPRMLESYPPVVQKIENAYHAFERFRTCDCCLRDEGDFTVSCHCIEHGGDGFVRQTYEQRRTRWMAEEIEKEGAADEKRA